MYYAHIYCYVQQCQQNNKILLNTSDKIMTMRKELTFQTNSDTLLQNLAAKIFYMVTIWAEGPRFFQFNIFFL
jgi:uncharacterized membrane protein